jgi:hypothetical protein
MISIIHSLEALFVIENHIFIVKKKIMIIEKHIFIGKDIK